MYDAQSEKTIVLLAHGSGTPSYDADWKHRLVAYLEASFPKLRFHMGFLNNQSFASGPPFPEEGDPKTWVVMPLALDEGCLTRIRIPQAIRQYEQVHGKHGAIVVCPVLNLTPEAAVFRLLELQPGTDRADTGVLIVQHGSSRFPSGRGVALAVRWAQRYPQYGGFYSAWLNQEPTVEKMIHSIPQKRIVVVNWFLFRGRHVMCDIPEALKLPARAEDLFGWHKMPDGRDCFYSQPVGESPEFLAMARDGVWQRIRQLTQST